MILQNNFLALIIETQYFFLSFLKFRCVQLKQAIDDNKNAIQKLNKLSITVTHIAEHLFSRAFPCRLTLHLKT